MGSGGIIFLIVLILIQSVLSIASSSIAIQAYNENPSYNPYNNETIRKNNFIYLWSNIGSAIFVFMVAMIMFLAGGLEVNCAYEPM